MSDPNPPSADPVPPPAERRRGRPAPTGRPGRILRRLRWPVLIVWVLAVVVLNPLAGGLSKVTNDTAAAYLPPSAQSTKVAEMQENAQNAPGQPQTDSLTVVFVRPSGLTPDDLAAVDSARMAVDQLVGHVTGLTAAGPAVRSRDGQADEFTAHVTAPILNLDSVETTAVKAVRQIVQGPPYSTDGLQIQVGGSAASNADSGSGSNSTLLLTALLIVAIILLLVYRSPVLWLLPLIGAIGAIVVAQAAAHGLASAGLTVSSLSTAILIVLVFGAASDYALLLTHRYRDELRHHAAVEDAMAVALRTTLPTLAASAATVTGAMLCLLAAESASLHGLGPVGAVAIVSALLAQTTFLPALLLVFGRAAFWPRIPRHGQAGREESRLWAGIGVRVARHPGRIALCAVVLLGAACVGLASLRADNNPLDNLKGDPGSVVASRLYSQHYGSGSIAPLVVLVPQGEATAATTAIEATPEISAVSDASASQGAAVQGYADLSVDMTVPSYSSAGYPVIVNLRDRLDQAAPGSLVGGAPAIQYDGAQAANRDSAVLIPLVLVVILIVIALLLRAFVAPLVLVLTTALSFAASFGLSSLLWRYAFGYGGIQSVLPLYIFIFLVALGVDYNIFLSARIREEARSVGTRPGTLRGLGVTGGVITAAGIVLAATFAALAQRPLVNLTEVGTSVALGVLLDTLLVRTVLVPALLLTIGDRVWWPSRPARRPAVVESADPEVPTPTQIS